jgi:hypothetical protein
MSYEEWDTCHMRRRIHDTFHRSRRTLVLFGVGYLSYEEEDTCHMRRRIDVI